MFARPRPPRDPLQGEYREVVAPKRWCSPSRTGPTRSTSWWSWCSATWATAALMLFQQHGRMSAKQYERAGEGWSSFFDRMAEHLADA
jgi:uncharacterized protein YndB with AHSA1/START domain